MKIAILEKEIIIVTLIMLLITPIFAASNAFGFTSTQFAASNKYEQSTAKQKISQYLIEQMTEYKTQENPLIRILIKYNPTLRAMLPERLKVLNEFKIVPLISALASTSEIEQLAKLEGVEYIYPDMKVYASSETPLRPTNPSANDAKNFLPAANSIPQTPWFGEYPCFLNESTSIIKADELWADGITGQGVIIAVLDTGINKYHPDLDDLDDDPATCDPKVLAENAFIEEPIMEVGDPMDYNGHGTHVASIAAGTGGTGGMSYYGTYFGGELFNGTIWPGTERGAAPDAYLYNVKVLNSGGWGYDSWIVAGIEWAVDHGADIISMSLGGSPAGPPEEDPMALALEAATEHDVVCVVAAGNSGFGYFSLGSPAYDPKIITVGATTETNELADFSSRGPEQFELHAKPDILAPGACIVAAFAGFTDVVFFGWQVFYWELSGTSMATPHVAGSAALLLQAFPGATPYAVKSAMMLGAQDLGLDPMAQGAGLLDVTKARELMSNAPKEDRNANIPKETVSRGQISLRNKPNFTDVSILVENSFCYAWMMSTFLDTLAQYGATITYGSSPYTNDILVDPITEQPLYDVFVLSEPYFVDESLISASTLSYYLQHNGTVLFTGDKFELIKDYANWTRQWGISWDNKAVGGLSSNLTSHATTEGIQEIYFGNPMGSLILDSSVDPAPQCIAWDPLFPGVAVWETPAPSSGKVIVLSDDGILGDQFIQVADNMMFGFNIIKWLTGSVDMYACESQLVPIIESLHPYPGDSDLWVPVFAPLGSDWISLHFTKIDVEYGYDFVTIYDELMNPVDMYTGYYENVWTRAVNGEMLWVELQSDRSYEYWGYAADAYLYGNIASMAHEIAIGGSWNKYVVANSTFTLGVDVQNFGNYTEDVMLRMSVFDGMDILVNDWNFANVTLASGEAAAVDATPEVILNATNRCDRSGPHAYIFTVIGYIYNSSSGMPPYLETYFNNNMFFGEVTAVPKTARTGLNPILSVITPKEITSTGAPLITMFPKDFTMHNITAFVSGGALENVKFQITGSAAQIAGFVNVSEFTYHTWIDTLPDPSPAYFIPNTTIASSSFFDIDNVEAPTMLCAPLQVYVAENTLPGVYEGTLELINGTSTLASINLSFEVKNAKYKILWEDYYNDYQNQWLDCERLWGGSTWGLGVFEWWKLASKAGFDIDSLHQQAYLKRHAGFFGMETFDPLGIIAYGGYDALVLHDCDFSFRPAEISMLRQLYKTGKLDVAVLLDGGSEWMSNFTSHYGINISGSNIDLLVDKFDKTHPIFEGVNNFTLYGGPMLNVGTPEVSSATRGIAVATGDLGISSEGGFVVATNEMQATSHLASRMVVVSDANTFEFLEYSDYVFWLYTYIFTGEGVIGKTGTNVFAVNLLKWLDPQFTNQAPEVDYFNASPSTAKIGVTVSVDTIVHDPDGDNFNVTVAVHAPDDSWSNATVVAVGGHWYRSFTVTQEGMYDVYVVAVDSYGATTELLGATVEAVNATPEIVSASISPANVVQGGKVFIVVSVKDAEDGAPVGTQVSVIAPGGSSYSYNFSNVLFANVNFDTSGKPIGVYSVSVATQDSNGAQTVATVGLFETQAPPANNAPMIKSYAVSPSKTFTGESVFITVGCEDAEDGVPANITLIITAPNGTTITHTFNGMSVASLSFNTGNKPIGVYQVTATVQDSEGAMTSGVIGDFEVKATLAAEFPMREATLGVSIVGLILLIAAVLLLFMRLPRKPKPEPTPTQ